jgi:hypothetical protein
MSLLRSTGLHDGPHLPFSMEQPSLGLHAKLTAEWRSERRSATRSAWAVKRKAPCEGVAGPSAHCFVASSVFMEIYLSLEPAWSRDQTGLSKGSALLLLPHPCARTAVATLDELSPRKNSMCVLAGSPDASGAEGFEASVFKCAAAGTLPTALCVVTG